jgi:hypothetical protein
VQLEILPDELSMWADIRRFGFKESQYINTGVMLSRRSAELLRFFKTSNLRLPIRGQTPVLPEQDMINLHHADRKEHGSGPPSRGQKSGICGVPERAISGESDDARNEGAVARDVCGRSRRTWNNCDPTESFLCAGALRLNQSGRMFERFMASDGQR